jgi:ribonuclease VapC
LRVPSRQILCGVYLPPALNFGDCFAYALAQSTSEPLLFKGEDFAQTDVKKALA